MRTEKSLGRVVSCFEPTFKATNLIHSSSWGYGQLVLIVEQYQQCVGNNTMLVPVPWYQLVWHPGSRATIHCGPWPCRWETRPAALKVGTQAHGSDLGALVGMAAAGLRKA